MRGDPERIATARPTRSLAVTRARGMATPRVATATSSSAPQRVERGDQVDSMIDGWLSNEPRDHKHT